MSLLVFTGLLAAASPADKPAMEVPITGTSNPELASFDRLMTDFLKKQHLPGTLRSRWLRNGKLIYSRGFGYADQEKHEAVEPAALFRISSLSKSLTAVAILQLVERNKLKLDSSVFEVLQLKEPAAPRGQFDDRWKRITIRQLLQHTGGWNRERTFDPMFRSEQIVKTLEVKSRLARRGNHSIHVATAARFRSGQ